VLAKSSDSPRADALLLLERALGRPRAWIVAHDEAVVAARAAAEFAALCKRRASGTPIAYLLGYAGFYGREFVVNPRVLIPRPETEHLVDAAIAFINQREADRDNPPLVLDVGVGSGAVACTLAAETQAAVDGTDTSHAAIELANENARRLEVVGRCRFYQGDLADPVQDRRYDLIIANLPYVPTRDLPKPPEPASFEPREALDGGHDGLDCYRRLLPATPHLLKPNALVLLEAAAPNIEALASLTRKSLPDFTISVCRDYAALPRYVKAQGAR
jgi:release factor glutamine methyltransferase